MLEKKKLKVSPELPNKSLEGMLSRYRRGWQEKSGVEGEGHVWNLASWLPTGASFNCHFIAGFVSQETKSLHSFRKTLLRNSLS